MIKKNSSIEEKITFIKHNLNNPDEINDVAVLNILNLVGGGNLSSDLFKADNIIFNSLSEFSDIKTALKTELNDLRLKLTTYYLSTLTSCHFIPVCKKEDIKPVPKLYRILMCNLGIFTLNKLLSKHLNNIDKSNLFIVEDAIHLLKIINEPLLVLDSVVGKLFVG
jgi:hypothetical protein